MTVTDDLRYLETRINGLEESYGFTIGQLEKKMKELESAVDRLERYEVPRLEDEIKRKSDDIAKSLGDLDYYVRGDVERRISNLEYDK
jgi:hypothetical protein